MSAHLNSSQVLILQALKARPEVGLTRQEIADKAGGACCSPQNLGPVTKESLSTNEDYSDSLYGHGYVYPSQDEGETTRWFITKTGVKVSSTLRTLETPETSETLKIPEKHLIQAGRKFRSTRTYGFERATPSDLKEMIGHLPPQFSTIDAEDFLQRLINLRKQGKFTTRQETLGKSVKKVIREFGPEGTVLALLTSKQVAALLEFVEHANAE